MKISYSSHLDHGLSPLHLAFLFERFGARTGFFAETVELPSWMPALPCGLHGPAMGDAPVPEAECHHAVRGARPGTSRLCGREPRLVRQMTVIGGPDSSAPCVLYTAHGGPMTPCEPFDLDLDEQGRAEAAAFWAEHALSVPEVVDLAVVRAQRDLVRRLAMAEEMFTSFRSLGLELVATVGGR